MIGEWVIKIGVILLVFLVMWVDYLLFLIEELETDLPSKIEVAIELAITLFLTGIMGWIALEVWT